MYTVRFLLPLLFATAVGSAQAGEGLKLDPDTTLLPRWQVRLALVGPTTDNWSHSDWNATPRVGVARLSSDYYFGKQDSGDAPGGLRATGALLLGPRNLALGAPSPTGSASMMVRSSSLSGDTLDTGDVGGATPYLGVGYSAGWAKLGLNLSADLGLMGQRSGAVRLGRSYGGTELSDDALHDLRITPVFQLNLSYSF